MAIETRKLDDQFFTVNPAQQKLIRMIAVEPARLDLDPRPAMLKSGTPLVNQLTAYLHHLVQKEALGSFSQR